LRFKKKVSEGRAEFRCGVDEMVGPLKDELRLHGFLVVKFRILRTPRLRLIGNGGGSTNNFLMSFQDIY